MPGNAHRRLALSLSPVPVKVGPCMSHLLEPGDEAILEPCNWKRLRFGDLVALDTPAGPVLHRYLGARRTRQGIRLLTKGARAPAFDRILPPEALLGRVTGIKRNGHLIRRHRGIPLTEIPAAAARLGRGNGIQRNGRTLLRPRGIPLAELPALAASLALGLSALLRRRIIHGHAGR